MNAAKTKFYSKYMTNHFGGMFQKLYLVQLFTSHMVLFVRPVLTYNNSKQMSLFYTYLLTKIKPSTCRFVKTKSQNYLFNFVLFSHQVL